MIKEVYESVKECVKTLEKEKEKYVYNPKVDFTRLRKISFSDCIMSVCCMSGGTLFSELLEFYQDYRLLAVDGSEVQIPVNPKDEYTFFPGANGQKPYNLIHLNAMYDLLSNSYLDVVVQGRKHCAEHKALNQMVDRSDIEQALVMADRGYESYNVMAHTGKRMEIFA